MGEDASSATTNHLHFMSIALEEAKKCIPAPSAFGVGCVITVPDVLDADGKAMILSRGYSRELPGNTHAEANALSKARSLSTTEMAIVGTDSVAEVLERADVYTTMEPCSVRLSGLAPCANALIDAKVKRCYIGVAEPADFVNCEGAQKLIQAGIEVVWLNGLEDECLTVARNQAT